MLFRSQGYTVITAVDGKEALEICQEKHRQIDLVISDVVMPKMDGRQLYKHIVKRCPETKFLFISGYTGSDIRNKFIFEQGIPFMSKPFTLTQLAGKVREALDKT